MSKQISISEGTHGLFSCDAQELGRPDDVMQLSLKDIVCSDAEVSLQQGTADLWMTWDELCRLHHDSGAMIARITKEHGVADTQAGDGDGGHDVAAVGDPVGAQESRGFMSADVLDGDNEADTRAWALREIVAQAIAMAVRTPLCERYGSTNDRVDIVLGSSWERAQTALGQELHYREVFGTAVNRAIALGM